MNWYTDGIVMVGGDDAGGDDRANGLAFTVRFRCDEAPNAVIDWTVYPVNDDGDPGYFPVQVETEFSICDDPDHPGETEQWSGLMPYFESPVAYLTVLGAEQAARDAADNMTGQAATWTWDGQPVNVYEATWKWPGQVG